VVRKPEMSWLQDLSEIELRDPSFTKCEFEHEYVKDTRDLVRKGV